MYIRNINLMDKSVFPSESLYLSKQYYTPLYNAPSRKEKTDEEISVSVTADLASFLFFTSDCNAINM